jgi:hypothetical protein
VGIFDHHKQWDFETRADAAACVVAFSEALTGRNLGASFRMTGRWDVRKLTQTSARATYKGRGGVLRGITPISQGATREQQAAKGSELSFEVSPPRAQRDRTKCSLWLSHRAVISIAFIPFTADARFIRGSMRQVAQRLRTADPTTTLLKH